MATRVSENPVVESHYVTQTALTSALLAALRALWPRVVPVSGAEAAGAYREGVVALVDKFALASISLSADYYEDVRAAAGVDTAFRVPIVDPPPRELVDAGLDWALEAKAEMDKVEAAIQARVEAAMQKAVMDAGRGQVVAAVEGDELALGFARVAKATACAFCLTLAFRRTKAGRPGVYKSRATAGQLDPNALGEVNRYHNNCQCVVVPIFSPDYALEPQIAAAEDLYNEVTANSKSGELLNDFRKALAGHRVSEDPATGAPASAADQMAALLGRLAGN